MQVRRADDGDADAIAVLVADAYGHDIERTGRRPKPMTVDQHAAVRDHEVWVARDVVDDSLVGVLDPVESQARRRGYQEIGLETNERFVENLAICARRGYRETGRTPAGGTSVVQMSKRLDRV